MKRYTKLLSAVLLLVTTLVMLITTSYAWMTMSNAPVVEGIQITVVGSHTVMVAPDISYVKDGQVIHHPGKFSESLNFSQYDQYDYLQQSGGLVPVSTSDGQIWYIPVYYQLEDREVQSGDAYAGQLRPFWDFKRDDTFAYANLTASDEEKMASGSYVYLDFWVVAPVDGYKLRVSTGDEGAGSFGIDLLKPEATVANGETVYGLTGENKQAAACMRVGFMVNEDIIMNDSMLLYSRSDYYNSSYSRLQGVMPEPGMGSGYSSNTSFTIFEPNGDLHPTEVIDSRGNTIVNGQYVLTEPLGRGGATTSIQDRLTVQLTNSWIDLGGETAISQMFRTFMAGRDLSGETPESLQNKFYVNTLQHQIYPYVQKGRFLTSTESLYAVAGSDKIADAEQIAGLPQSGATEDVYLTELTGGVPQRIRMFIWLEGQDVDCINAAATSSFAVSIELAGSNAS